MGLVQGLDLPINQAMPSALPHMASIDSLRLHDGRSLCVRTWRAADPVVMLHAALRAIYVLPRGCHADDRGRAAA
jgi:hypothetical protein